MKRNWEFLKKIVLLSVLVIVLFNCIQNIEVLSQIFALVSPLIIGLCIAFLINLILLPLEKAWEKICTNRKKKKNRIHSFKRPVCLFFSILIFLGVICTAFFVLIPQLKKAGTDFAEHLPSYISELDMYWRKVSDFLCKRGITLPEINLKPDVIMNTISDFFAEKGRVVVGKSLEFTISAFRGIINAVLAFIISLYLLAQKELWQARAKRFMTAFLPKKTKNVAMRILSLSNTIFTNFVTGQVTDALVIGILCFIGMLIFRFPNALPVSVIVCFTALIPIFGAWIGAIIGAALILVVSPLKAFWFIVFLVLLQQIEGNFIYPKIVGNSVGLPGLWVLIAVTLGGGAFGILGMLLSVPIFAILYTLVQEHIEKKKGDCSS